MHTRIQEVLDHLDTSRAALKQAVASVPADMLAARPAPERWSVVDVIDHLALVETRVARLLVSELQKAKANGLPSETSTSGAVEAQLVSGLLDRTKPLVAGETSQPRGISLESAWATLDSERSALRDAIAAADGLALGTVRIPHPRLGDLDLYQWFTFLGAHESRHVEQIHETRAALQTPPA